MLNQIIEAELRIRPYIFHTPLHHSPVLSELTGNNVFLKLESEQITGSFKARGALNKVLKMNETKAADTCVTASTGNHALGFANALKNSDVKGIIFMPENASKAKVDLLSLYDVELKFFGQDSLTTELEAKRYAEENGLIYVSPYNDEDIIAGQGTIAFEIIEDLEKIDKVYGCIGGGGLMSGCSSYFKKISPNTEVIGCLPENSAEMYLSVQKGEVVELDNPSPTLSDGSAGGLEPGSITFELCRDNVDRYLLSTEEEIASAMKLMIDKHHKIIEGAAGVALSSMLKDENKGKGENIVVIICGANVSTETLKEQVL